jgi:hypothetical protein
VTWCHDIARDEAIRAAEDGRSGPLPTLDECIQRQAQYVSFGNSGSLSGDSDQNWHSASVGGEPVAWMCEWTDHTSIYQSRIYAESAAGGDVVPQPLYRSPRQAVSVREERKPVAWCVQAAAGSMFHAWTHTPIDAAVLIQCKDEADARMMASVYGHKVLGVVDLDAKEVPRG